MKKIESTRGNLQAFTLINVMIGIVISGLTLLAFYNGYEFIRGEIDVYGKQQTAVLDALNLQLKLEKDFMQSKKVYAQENQSLMLDMEERQVIYRFDPAFVIRQESEQTDSFHLSVKEYVVKLNEQEWVESVEFHSQLDKQEIFLLFKKEYTAVQLMEGVKQETWP